MDFTISADLLLTVPLVYFLLIRKTAIPNTTTIPVMIIGLLIGSYLMPAESQTYLSMFKNWALPIIELSIFVFVITKVRATIKKFRAVKGNSDDFYSALKHTYSEILPAPVATLMASEIAVIYYSFFNWGRKVYKENEFTYHKNSGAQGLFGGFMLVIGIETFVLHNLVAEWSIIAAWILSGLSIYTALQLLGFARSLAARPISIVENSVNLKYGIMNEVSITFDEIESIEISSRELDKGKLEKKLSLLGELESHNVIIQLKNEQQLVGLYGMKSEFKVLGFYIDTALEFKAKLDDLIQNGR
uniref:hypothetical protein n=1 Tax=Fulvivirga sp. TaxID=1931237 RepID=UPI00404929E2